MKKLTFKIILFSFSLSDLSCAKRDKEIDFKIIERISNENPELPSTFTSTLLFGKCKDEDITVLQSKDLRIIHKDKYKDLKFSKFVDLALNQKIDLSYPGKIVCFSLNSDVKEFYENNKFDAFLKKFCEKVDNKILKIKSGTPKEKINSILYFLFIHNYINFFDDMAGSFYILKSNDL